MLASRRTKPGALPLAVVLALATAPPPPPVSAAGPPTVGKLTWLGQSCFLLETAKGTRVLMDPVGKGLGYDVPGGVQADLVTISHEHPDHNNLGLVTGKPRVIRGLTADKKGWTRINEKFKDVAIRTVGVYHDEKRGAERGLNTIFVFEIGGLRIAHLGDLGHRPVSDRLAAIGAVDVLLIPVGGKLTLGGREASRLVDELRPRLLVVPMHFKTPAGTSKELEPVDDFLEKKPNVRRENGPTVALSPLKSRPGVQIVVLTPGAPDLAPPLTR